MIKNIIIGCVILLVIVLGFMWYKNSQVVVPALDSAATVADSSDTSSTSTGSTKTGVKTTNTLPAIFAQTGSHVCTYEQVSQTSKSTNSIYIADGKMRGEFRTSSTAKTTLVLMVYSNGTLYTWNEGKSTGTKTSVRTIADIPSVIPKDLTSGAVFGSGLNSVGWDCHDWSKDAKLLTPPTYVTFS